MSAASLVSLRTETTHFNIRFENNPKGFYHPNETIHGTVELHVEKAIRAAKGLKLSITGAATCAWKKLKGKKTPVFQGKQVYIDYVTHFFGRQDGAHIEVSTGVHLYSFTCKIPPNAVSSHEGTHGCVRYKITVLLESPSLPDVIYEAPFNVLRIESLNDFPWLRRGTEVEYEHQVGMLCCEALPLELIMRLERLGYALGEQIKVHIAANNQGPARFRSALISLDRVEICNSREPEASFIRTRKVVTFCTTKSINQFETLDYDEMLQIPEDMPVSSERNCQVFQVAYQVKYSAKCNNRSKFETFLPITIAHIPYSPEEEEEGEGANADHAETKSEYDQQSEPLEESQPVRTPRRGASARMIGVIPAI